MARPYSPPRFLETRVILPHHVAQLEASAIDFVAGAFAAVSSITHGQAHDLGIRGDGDLGGLCFRYWQPQDQRFSKRFIRVKPDVPIADRKYLQPVGEKPTLYFPAGTTGGELENPLLPVLITEGEKKALALHRALHDIDQPGLVIGLGGVWSWRLSPKETQPDGRLGKGKSRPIADLNLIVWQGRTVYLIFDSDVVTNVKVSHAESVLARELYDRGAHVHIVRIPGGDLCRRLASTI